jgi:hypothetical protein
MKKFLRDRKNSIDTKSKPIVSAPTPLGSAEPPLYARFATTARDQDAAEKSVVSGPMQLSSKTSVNRGHNAGTSRSVGGGHDRHSKVLTKMPSRPEQVQSPPQVIASPPTRSSSRVPVPPLAPPKPAPMPHAAASRMPSYESRKTRQSVYSQPAEMEASSSRVQLPDSISKDDSLDSDSYIAPPRPLVVRNIDPETSSTTSRSESGTGPTGRLPTQAPASPTYITTQQTRVQQIGYALHDPWSQPVQSSQVARPQPNLKNVATSPHLRYPAGESAHTTSYTPQAVSSHIPHRPAQASLIIPPAASRETALASVLPSYSPPQSPQTRPVPSLLSTPSVTRRKYSPMAAFGLSTSSSVEPSTLITPSSSTQVEPVSTSRINEEVYLWWLVPSRTIRWMSLVVVSFIQVRKYS